MKYTNSNLIGETFGKLTVIEKDISTRWICRCSCGEIKSIPEKILIIKRIKSCGKDNCRYNKYEEICMVESCKNKQYQRGYCAMHLRRVKKYGDPLVYKVDTKMKQGESNFNVIFHVYKRSAKVRSLDFNLNKEEFKKLTLGNCFYCDSIPMNIQENPGTKGPYVYNGIDRKDNKQGYTLDNCVPCCKECNFMKRDMKINDFLHHIEMIYNHSKNKNYGKK